MKHNKRTSRTGKSLWTGRRDTVKKKSHVAVIGSIWQAGHQSVSQSSSNPSTSGSAAACRASFHQHSSSSNPGFSLYPSVFGPFHDFLQYPILLSDVFCLNP
ncbi:hypothetical protein BDQ94DRAFT_33240 [Aspergillus welwitschiae]|uniref:Uncharacterized protein n=1 Tax=Aspergillus welwitschiae TaxID=1341132 RepID=A0A3F3Q253_9EURO|nr:hypothetical protein BDQ94DRAFT_33240 [Aspergillus welwitschiae]RDH33165.1 hypothetical protein BDQ94DRAFT_33240 [Aspergillus welwitschiae]